MRVAFRLDATAALGWGHLKRCLALALALRAQAPADITLAFVGRSSGPSVARMLAQHGLTWLELPAPRELSEATAGADDAAATLSALAWTPEVLVVDHYALDSRWHADIRAACDARIVVIDDLADRPLAPDLLIDPNPSTDHATKYAAVLSGASTVRICGGPAHALLDPVYAQHVRSVWRETPQTLGIFMGGTDPTNHSTWVLRLLRQRLGWTGAVRVASTSANPNLTDLRQAASTWGADLLLDLPHLADFHAGCDVQVGAGGGALWERCCLGVPTVALICADNQRQSIPQAAALGVVLGVEAIGQTEAQAADLLSALHSLITDAPQRLALRQRALTLVDGQGAMRVAQRVCELIAQPAAPQPQLQLQLRPATMADAARLLAWRNDAGTRANSHSSETVSAEEHAAWLQRSLNSPQRQLWLAWRGPTAVGTVRADQDLVAGHTTLSWTVAPDQRGSGVGRAMVQLAAQRISGPLHAEVKVGNAASARIAQALGLVLTDQQGDTLHFKR